MAISVFVLQTFLKKVQFVDANIDHIPRKSFMFPVLPATGNISPILTVIIILNLGRSEGHFTNDGKCLNQTDLKRSHSLTRRLEMGQYLVTHPSTTKSTR